MTDANKEELALRIHAESTVVDSHSDIPCDVVKRRRLGERGVLKRIHCERLRAGGIDAIVMSTMAHLMHYPERFGDYVEGGLNVMDCMLSEEQEGHEMFRIVTRVGDIHKANSEGRIAMLLGFEGAEPLGNDLANLRMFYKLGLRILQLTWNYRNNVCDGVGESGNSGLSNLGLEVVREMNRLGMMIDIAHISEKGFQDVLEISEDPVCVSHTASKRVHDHARNLSDVQMKMLAEKGGVVGIAFYPQFIRDRDARLKDVLDHVDHMTELVGPESVGLGPDFIDYCTDIMVPALRQAGIKDYGDVNIYPEGVEDVTKLPNFTKGLLERGYSEKEVSGILGGNYLRILEKVIG